jgi:hypothetical protein
LPANFSFDENSVNKVLRLPPPDYEKLQERRANKGTQKDRTGRKVGIYLEGLGVLFPYLDDRILLQGISFFLLEGLYLGEVTSKP